METPSCLKTTFHGHSAVAFSLSSFLLVVCACLSVLEVFLYFFPFIFSAGICFKAFSWFCLLKDLRGREKILPSKGSQGEEGHQRVRAAQFDCCADFVIDVNRLEMQCFEMENLKRRWQGGDDGAQMEVVVYEGRHEKVNENGGFGEEDKPFSAESLAEGLWNSYFGRYSRWHYEEETVEQNQQDFLGRYLSSPTDSPFLY